MADGPGLLRRAAALPDFGRLLLGHLKPYRTARLQDLATATVRDESGAKAWVVPAINRTIRARQALTRAGYLGPRRLLSRARFTEPADAPTRHTFSLLCPTRGRPDGLRALVDSVRRTAHHRDRVEILCYVDSDDPTLDAYLHLGTALDGCTIQVGDPVGVPKAWNSLAAACTGDFLVMANDDQLYVDYGWDVTLDRRLVELEPEHPDGVLCLYFDAGQYPEGGCDFPMVSRAWYEALGYFAREGFQQWSAERWIFDIARRIERLHPVPGVLVEHLHYQDYKAPFDATYLRHRITRDKSFADQALFVRTAPDRARAADRLRRVIADRTPQPPSQRQPGETAMTTDHVIQAARRHYCNIIDAWNYGGRRDEARECAELAVEQGLWVDPLQRAKEYVPGLRTQAIYDPDEFWFTAYLQEHFEQIRDEVAAVMDTDLDPVRPTVEDSALIRKGGWRQAHLFRDGQWRDCAVHFPVTRAILEKVPEFTTHNPGIITVSRIEAGTHIMPHCGPTNAQLRVHLPLIVPPDVSLRIGERQLTWEEGRCMAFDESFEHEVWHRGSSDRVVLILDTVHPDLGGSGGDAERVRQHRIATEAQILDFMRESGLERVELCDGGVVLHPDPALHELARRYMELTGIEGASLDGDDVTWHRGA